MVPEASFELFSSDHPSFEAQPAAPSEVRGQSGISPVLAPPLVIAHTEELCPNLPNNANTPCRKFAAANKRSLVATGLAAVPCFLGSSDSSLFSNSPSQTLAGRAPERRPHEGRAGPGLPALHRRETLTSTRCPRCLPWVIQTEPYGWSWGSLVKHRGQCPRCQLARRLFNRSETPHSMLTWRPSSDCRRFDPLPLQLNRCPLTAADSFEPRQPP